MASFFSLCFFQYGSRSHMKALGDVKASTD